MKLTDNKKKRIGMGMAAGGIAVIILVITLTVIQNNKDDVVYKEAKVEFGVLSKGVTESGSVDVGTTTQSFELDISQFTGESSFSFGGGMQGMDIMGGMSSMGGMTQTASSSSDTRSLEIEAVYVEAGEEVTAETPLLKLTEESVESIRSLLAEDVTSAQIVYEQAVTAKKQTQLSAENDYETNILYGEYARAEYDQSMKSLQEGVDEAQEALEEAQETLSQAQEKLTEKETLLAEQKLVLANAEYAEEGTDERENLYWWMTAWQTKEEVKTLVESLEEEIEVLKEDILTYEEAVSSANIRFLLAEKEFKLGEINAEGTLAVRDYQAQNAQEIYDVATEQGAFDEESAQADYEEAKAKLEEFDAQIVNQMVYAAADGLITDVHVAAGDTLMQNVEIISMNDYDAVTITLSVEEEDMDSAQVGNPVNVTVAAYSEEVFQGEVTEIGDAEIDSNTNKTLYSVTVTIQNIGDILYQDMTAEVTFLTAETAEVLYVPNKVLMQENGKTYVLVKDETGSMEQREVTTGMSDGVNTEIKEGLSEGETVLWESKVKQS